MKKQRIRKTGEVVEVISYSGTTNRSDVLDYVSYIDSKGVEHHREHLNLFWDLEAVEPSDMTAYKLTNERLQVAAKAMQGLLSNEYGFQFNDKDVAKSPENVAEAAVMYADALLNELNKKNNEDNPSV